MFGCFAVCFWVLTIVALDVVPKLIGDGCYMSMGKWSNLASIKSQNIVDVDSAWNVGNTVLPRQAACLAWIVCLS